MFGATRAAAPDQFSSIGVVPLLRLFFCSSRSSWLDHPGQLFFRQHLQSAC
jgi:hypothetical protein